MLQKDGLFLTLLLQLRKQKKTFSKSFFLGVQNLIRYTAERIKLLPFKNSSQVQNRGEKKHCFIQVIQGGT